MTVMGPDGLMHVQPNLPVHAVKTYAVASPQRPATCEQVGCGAHLNGWRTIVPADGPAAAYIRQDRSRRHTETRTGAGLAEFTFEPGQRCFAVHTLPAEGAEKFVERGGDWRGNPRGELRVHTRAGDWQDSFANHQDRLRTAIERG